MDLDVINNNYINRKKTYSSCERLKPSSDVLSGQMKRIKLDGNSTTANCVTNKRKMSVDTVSICK